MSLPTIESSDCFDGMIIYGLSSNLEKYNECKKKIDMWLIEEIVKEYGIEGAIIEGVLTEEEVSELIR